MIFWHDVSMVRPRWENISLVVHASSIERDSDEDGKAVRYGWNTAPSALILIHRKLTIAFQGCTGNCDIYTRNSKKGDGILKSPCALMSWTGHRRYPLSSSRC